MNRAEVLASLQKQNDNLMLREPHSSFEEWLRNNIAVLISVVRDQERIISHLCPDKSDDI
jgi:hypothetical protein